MSTTLKISPEKAIIFPVGGDDQIVTGLQMETDPNALLLRIFPGRVIINGLYFDVLEKTNSAYAYETDCNSAPVGRSLVALDQTLSLKFINDNIPADHVVIGVIDKTLAYGKYSIFITPIEYLMAAPTISSSNNIFAPTVSVETQLKLLFEELAINKDRDLQLKYEEMLESLPTDYNAAFIESFADSSNFVTNELVYNPYSHVISLGILPPYPTIEKTLVESITLANAISTGYFVLDYMDNSQMVSAKLSFDNGVTWVDYAGDNYYSAGTGNQIKVQITLKTNFTTMSPQVRSWALFYHKN